MTHCYNSQVNTAVNIQICTYSVEYNYANVKPLCLPVRTSYKAFSKRWNWIEIHVPLCFKDLPHNTVLGLIVL